MARKFERPAPGKYYTAEQRAAWGAEQDRLRAQRNAPGFQKPAPAKRKSRAKVDYADVGGSTCFDSLSYQGGIVTASFIGPAAGIWQYEMSRADWNAWKSSDSLGGFFNAMVR